MLLQGTVGISGLGKLVAHRFQLSEWRDGQREGSMPPVLWGRPSRHRTDCANGIACRRVGLHFVSLRAASFGGPMLTIETVV